jgi:hypothetical protein
MLPLGLAGLFGITWPASWSQVILGLAGRLWIFAVAMAFYLVAVPDFFALQSGLEAGNRGYRDMIETMLPWLAGLAVVLKLLAAAWAFRASCRRRLWDEKTVTVLVAVWLAAVGVVSVFWCLKLGNHYGAWGNVPGRSVVLSLEFIVLLSPLARIAAAPLALEWNRRR